MPGSIRTLDNRLSECFCGSRESGDGCQSSASLHCRQDSATNQADAGQKSAGWLPYATLIAGVLVVYGCHQLVA
ncbi:hypothetical protein [Pseudomonas arsenicoxydans]|uniref:hypothetical protein n=1 Tax=Pseudomonas arsenicoxydans TaxID=702115 RepID=UPI000B7D32DA|nr:hypothetical protein [Pseudomonas arsenicoxydans]